MSLAALLGRDITIGAVLRRLRCRMCGTKPKVVVIETGPEVNARGRLRRATLLGPGSPHAATR